MRNPHRSLISRLAIVGLIVLAAALGGCGGDDGSTDTAGTDRNGSASAPETPADALATGEELCRVLGGRAALAKNWGTDDPQKLARRFSKEVYPGNFPEQAIKGCLRILQGSSGQSQ